ncbi:MAG: hypothetical protein KF901_28830 [Myxococcales bacterium]|nr:hypothetical protein [Myxococcales bacterium]
MQVDDRPPSAPSRAELEAEKRARDVIARFARELGARLPFSGDRERIEELEREVRPAVASLDLALAVEVAGDEASFAHHEGLAMIHLLGRRAAELDVSPFAAAQLVPALAAAFEGALPARFVSLLGATCIEGFVRGREEVVEGRARRRAAEGLPSLRIAPTCQVLVLAGDVEADAIEARGQAFARELFAAEAASAVLDLSRLVALDRPMAGALAEAVTSARVIGVTCHLSGVDEARRALLGDFGFAPEQLHARFDDALRAALDVAGLEVRPKGGLRRLLGR